MIIVIRREKRFSPEPRRSRDRLQQSWSNEHGEWQRTESTKKKKEKEKRFIDIIILMTKYTKEEKRFVI